PPLAPPGAGGQALRRRGRRFAHGAAGHRDQGRGHLGVHTDQRHLDHGRPDLPRLRPVQRGPAPCHRHGQLREPGGFIRADQGDEDRRRHPAPGPQPVPGARQLLPVRQRPRPGHPAEPQSGRAPHGDAQAERARADPGGGAGRGDLRRRQRLPRRGGDGRRPRLGGPVPGLPARQPRRDPRLHPRGAAGHRRDARQPATGDRALQRELRAADEQPRRRERERVFPGRLARRRGEI
ncbi:MAG: ATP synthase alpha chain, partial [uncultured Rubrobacteraceae bacterium]